MIKSLLQIRKVKYPKISKYLEIQKIINISGEKQEKKQNLSIVECEKLKNLDKVIL